MRQKCLGNFDLNTIPCRIQKKNHFAQWLPDELQRQQQRRQLYGSNKRRTVKAATLPQRKLYQVSIKSYYSIYANDMQIIRNIYINQKMGENKKYERNNQPRKNHQQQKKMKNIISKETWNQWQWPLHSFATHAHNNYVYYLFTMVFPPYTFYLFGFFLSLSSFYYFRRLFSFSLEKSVRHSPTSECV